MKNLIIIMLFPVLITAQENQLNDTDTALSLALV